MCTEHHIIIQQFIHEVSQHLVSCLYIPFYFKPYPLNLLVQDTYDIEHLRIKQVLNANLQPGISNISNFSLFFSIFLYFNFTLFSIKQLLSNFERQNSDKNKQLLGLTVMKWSRQGSQTRTNHKYQYDDMTERISGSYNKQDT